MKTRNILLSGRRRKRWSQLVLTVLALGSMVGEANAATQVTKLVGVGSTSGDFFGYSVLLGEGDLFVGSQRQDSDVGVVFAYPENATTGGSPQRINPPPDAGARYFGSTLVRSGDTLIVGGQRSDASDGGPETGAAYVYRLQGGQWVWTQTLVPSDLADRARFSSSLALQGDTLLVGAPFRDAGTTEDVGAVYVFARQGDGQWQEVQILESDDPSTGAQFGRSVGLEGSDALIGEYRADPTGAEDAGQVHAFALDELGSWARVQVITAPMPLIDAEFGSRIAMGASGAVVSAPADSVASPNAGAVYGLVKSGTGGAPWSVAQRLDPPTPEVGLQFGYSLSLSADGERLAVGALGEDVVGFDSGAAYVYRRESPEAWETAGQRIVAEDAGRRDNFGSAVSVNAQGLLAAGVRNDDDAGSNAGAAYVFDTTDEGTPAPVGTGAGLLVLGAGLLGLRRRARVSA